MAIEEQPQPGAVVRTQWDSDHVGGKSSVDIVLEWLTAEGNYDRWKAGLIPKSQLCDEVLAMLLAQGIQNRTKAMVYRKMYALETSMVGIRIALKQAKLRGFAPLEVCARAGIRRTILRQCPYYERIGPIMLKKRTNAAGQSNDAGGDSTEDDERGTANGHARAQEEDLEDDDFESENGRPVNFVKQEVIPRRERTPERTWDADCVREKTSMQVLLEWLKTGSKYELWRVFPMHRQAYGNQVRTAMVAQGIRNRSVDDINNKIEALSISMKYAKEYLREIGLPGLVTLGLCDRHVKREILRRCPEFEQLAPVMISSHDQQQENPMPSRRKRPRFNNSTEEGAPSSVPARSTHSETTSATRDEASEFTNENGPPIVPQQLAVSPIATAHLNRQRELPQQTFVSPIVTSDEVKVFDQLELDQRRSRFDQECQQRQIDLDTAREKSKIELAKSRIDLEKNEIELAVARALARQKLLSAGISPAEVDHVLPRQRVGV